MNRRLAFALFVLLGIVHGMGILTTAAAQTGGQLCVRSFDDRNGSGSRDPGEPPLTRGVSVNLLDTSGVTIASSLLDTAPNAAQGVVCFQFLPAGQYSVVMTSADYTATTPDNITTVVSDTGVPALVEFGARLSATPTPAAAAPGELPSDLTRIVVALGGTLLAVGFMAFLGMLVYAFVFGRRRAPADARATTGTMRQVRDTGQVHPVNSIAELRRTRSGDHDADDDDPFRPPDDL